MRKFLITYDISDDKSRTLLTNRIEEAKNIKLSATAYLVCYNIKNIGTLYEDLIFNNTDNFNIIDIKNLEHIRTGINHNAEIDNFLSDRCYSFGEYLKHNS